MKRLVIPIVIGGLIFIVLAIPKVWLAMAYLEEAGWPYAKTFFTRILIDFLFAWVIALVVWIQLERKPLITTAAFCLSAIFVSAFWYSPIKNAPRTFRQDMAFIYDYVEAEPLRALPRMQERRVSQSESPDQQVLPPDLSAVEEEVEPQGPEDLVEQTFYTLLRAIKKYDYDTVLTLSDQKTWDYFTELKELALTADRSVLEKLKPINRFQILALRHLKGAQELVGMNEKRLFEQAVLQGWFYVGDKPEVRIDYIDLMPGGNEALADIIVQSIIPDERLEFTREQGIWKMNLLKLLPRQEENMLTTLHERNQSEEEFFNNFLKQETGRDPSPDIWNPLLPEQG